MGELGDLLTRHARDAAPGLLGAVVALGPVAIEITEAEAYGGGDDPGSHARSGRTQRNASMFAAPGTAYVYFSYGMHWCLNVTCLPEGAASAVLLRAGRVVSGHPEARGRRRTPSGAAPRDRDLARGPARLARALGVDRRWDGHDLLDPAGALRLLPGRHWTSDDIAQGPRVGVAGAGAAMPWRFWVRGEETVSEYRAAARPRVRPAHATHGAGTDAE